MGNDDGNFAAKNPNTPEPLPQAPYDCAHCGRPLNDIRWAINTQAGLVTFFHPRDMGGCGKVIGCQLIALPQQRVVAPSNIILPGGRRN